MTWNVTLKHNVALATVEFNGRARDLSDEFIADYGAKAFEMALDFAGDEEFFPYGGREHVATEMLDLYRARRKQKTSA